MDGIGRHFRFLRYVRLFAADALFIGVGEAAYGPIAPTIISDLYPVKIRGSVLAWFYAAIPVGRAGVRRGRPARLAIGILLGCTTGSAHGCVVFSLVRKTQTGQADLTHDQPVRQPHLREYLVLFRTPSYVLDTLGMTAMTFSIGGIAI